MRHIGKRIASALGILAILFPLLSVVSPAKVSADLPTFLYGYNETAIDNFRTQFSQGNIANLTTDTAAPAGTDTSGSGFGALDWHCPLALSWGKTLNVAGATDALNPTFDLAPDNISPDHRYYLWIYKGWGFPSGVTVDPSVNAVVPCALTQNISQALNVGDGSVTTASQGVTRQAYYVPIILDRINKVWIFTGFTSPSSSMSIEESIINSAPIANNSYTDMEYHDTILSPARLERFAQFDANVFNFSTLHDNVVGGLLADNTGALTSPSGVTIDMKQFANGSDLSTANAEVAAAEKAALWTFPQTDFPNQLLNDWPMGQDLLSFPAMDWGSPPDSVCTSSDMAKSKDHYPNGQSNCYIDRGTAFGSNGPGMTTTTVDGQLVYQMNMSAGDMAWEDTWNTLAKGYPDNGYLAFMGLVTVSYTGGSVPDMDTGHVYPVAAGLNSTLIAGDDVGDRLSIARTLNDLAGTANAAVPTLAASPFRTGDTLDSLNAVPYLSGMMTYFTIHVTDPTNTSIKADYTFQPVNLAYTHDVSLGHLGVVTDFLNNPGQAISNFVSGMLNQIYRATLGGALGSLAQASTDNLLGMPSLQPYQVAYIDANGNPVYQISPDSWTPCPGGVNALVTDTSAPPALQGKACTVENGAVYRQVASAVAGKTGDSGVTTTTEIGWYGYQGNPLYTVWSVVRLISFLLALLLIALFWIRYIRRLGQDNMEPLDFLARALLALLIVTFSKDLVQLASNLIGDVILLTNYIGSQIHGSAYSYTWIFNAFATTARPGWGVLLMFPIAILGIISLVIFALFLIVRIAMLSIVLALSPFWVISIMRDRQMKMFLQTLTIVFRLIVIPWIILVMMLLVYALIPFNSSDVVLQAFLSSFFILAMAGAAVWMSSKLVKGPIESFRGVLSTMVERTSAKNFTDWVQGNADPHRLSGGRSTAAEAEMARGPRLPVQIGAGGGRGGRGHSGGEGGEGGPGGAETTGGYPEPRPLGVGSGATALAYARAAGGRKGAPETETKGGVVPGGGALGGATPPRGGPAGPGGESPGNSAPAKKNPGFFGRLTKIATAVEGSSPVGLLNAEMKSRLPTGTRPVPNKLELPSSRNLIKPALDSGGGQYTAESIRLMAENVQKYDPGLADQIHAYTVSGARPTDAHFTNLVRTAQGVVGAHEDGKEWRADAYATPASRLKLNAHGRTLSRTLDREYRAYDKLQGKFEVATNPEARRQLGLQMNQVQTRILGHQEEREETHTEQRSVRDIAASSLSFGVNSTVSARRKAISNAVLGAVVPGGLATVTAARAAAAAVGSAGGVLHTARMARASSQMHDGFDDKMRGWSGLQHTMTRAQAAQPKTFAVPSPDAWIAMNRAQTARANMESRDHLANAMAQQQAENQARATLAAQEAAELARQQQAENQARATLAAQEAAELARQQEREAHMAKRESLKRERLAAAQRGAEAETPPPPPRLQLPRR